jgi:hypothetical protein
LVKAGDETLTNRVRSYYHNNWNSTAKRDQRLRIDYTERDNYVRLPGDKLGGLDFKLLSRDTAEATLDCEIFPFDPAQLR